MIAAVIVLLIRGALFGCAARRVSEYRQEPDGFWWGFWLGMLGLLIVVFRPAVWPKMSAASGGENKQEAIARAKKLCPECGARNNTSNENCFACGRSFHN